jgi:hypothetical protein
MDVVSSYKIGESGEGARQQIHLIHELFLKVKAYI